LVGPTQPKISPTKIAAAGTHVIAAMSGINVSANVNTSFVKVALNSRHWQTGLDWIISLENN
jgi:hypothetical protein